MDTLAFMIKDFLMRKNKIGDAFVGKITGNKLVAAQAQEPVRPSYGPKRRKLNESRGVYVMFSDPLSLNRSLNQSILITCFQLGDIKSTSDQL